MSIKSEVKEFFLRNIVVKDGNLRDREPNYPVSHFVNKEFIVDGKVEVRKIEVGNRFMKGNVPSDDVYEKLFNSIMFKEGGDNSASTVKQGLVKIATDQQVINRVNVDDNNVILTMTPSQLDLITKLYASVAKAGAVKIATSQLVANRVEKDNNDIPYVLTSSHLDIYTKKSKSFPLINLTAYTQGTAYIGGSINYINGLMYLNVSGKFPVNAVFTETFTMDITTVNNPFGETRSIFIATPEYIIKASIIQNQANVQISRSNLYGSSVTTSMDFNTGYILFH